MDVALSEEGFWEEVEGEVDVDEFEDLARKYGVMSIPTLILFEDGKELKRNIGFMDKERIEKWQRID